MAYAAITDVQALNAKRTTYSANTTPTAAQVTTFITNIAAEIDSVLAAAKTLTPVTAPASFVGFLLNLNALGAAALAETAQFPEVPSGAGDQASSPHSQRLWKMYQDGLASLKDGSAIDPLSACSSAEALAETYLTANPDNDPHNDGSEDGQQPAFSMQRSLRDF